MENLNLRQCLSVENFVLGRAQAPGFLLTEILITREPENLGELGVKPVLILIICRRTTSIKILPTTRHQIFRRYVAFVTTSGIILLGAMV